MTTPREAFISTYLREMALSGVPCTRAQAAAVATEVLRKSPAATPTRPLQSTPRVEKQTVVHLSDEEQKYYIDPAKEQLRRIQLALYTKFRQEGYSAHKGTSVNGVAYAPNQPLRPKDALHLAFMLAGRREGSRFAVAGSNDPTVESIQRAVEKLSTPDAGEKRQAYERMLAENRQHYYRVTLEHDRGGLAWKVQPGNRKCPSLAAAKRLAAQLDPP